jgi:hypothetical protein
LSLVDAYLLLYLLEPCLGHQARGCLLATDARTTSLFTKD